MAAIEGVWQIPLLLGWALGVMALRERPSRPSRLRLAAGMLALAAALYTEPSAALIVPIFVLVTLIAIWRAPGWRVRDWIAAGVAFSLGLLPLLIWYARFPRTYQDTFGRWLVHPANLRYPIEGIRAMTNHRRVGDVVHLFWDFYSPSHLFFAADSPAFCGMLATILAIPIAVGMYFLVSADRTTAEPARLLIAAGCVGGPLAAAMFGQTRSDEFGLVLAPFAILLAAYGTVTLWRTSRTLGRSLTVAGYLLAVIQGFLFFRRL